MKKYCSVHQKWYWFRCPVCYREKVVNKFISNDVKREDLK